MIKDWQRTWIIATAASLLFTHELDAMTHHEWRVLPFMDHLPDAAAIPLFVGLHIPLFAIIIGLIAAKSRRLSEWSRFVLAAFTMIHACLHAWFSDHPAYTFSGALSDGLIFGAGALGLVWCLATAIAWQRRRDAMPGMKFEDISDD